MKKAMNKRINKINVLIVVCFLLYFIFGLFFVFFGRIHNDEEFYFYAAFALTKGQVLYKDFFYHHGPVLPYIYAIPQILFGPSFVIGRLTSLFFGILMLFMVYKISSKLGNRFAALISVALMSFSLISIYNFTAIMTYTLSIFLALCSIYLLLTNMREPLKIFASVFLMALAVETRLVIAPGLVLLLFYIFVKHYKKISNIISALASLVLNFLFVVLPFLAIAKKQFIFDVLIWSLSQKKVFSEFGTLVTNKVFGLNFGTFYLDFLLDTARDFFIAIVVIVTAMIFFVIKLKNKEIKIKEFVQKNQILLFIFGTFFLIEMIYVLALYFPAYYTNYIYPLMCIFSGVVVSRFFENIKEARACNMLKILLLVAILLMPLIQERPVINFSQNITYETSDIYQLSLTAKKIRQYTNENDKIFTFTPIYAAAADRMVMQGMEQFYFGFFPTWGIEKAREYNVVNVEILLDYINSKKSGAIVLTDWYLGSEGFRARAVIDKYRPQINDAIDKNYYLAEKIEDINFEGNVYIYLPKKS